MKMLVKIAAIAAITFGIGTSVHAGSWSHETYLSLEQNMLVSVPSTCSLSSTINGSSGTGDFIIILRSGTFIYQIYAPHGSQSVSGQAAGTYSVTHWAAHSDAITSITW
jgi:hypothetical protein